MTSPSERSGVGLADPAGALAGSRCPEPGATGTRAERRRVLFALWPEAGVRARLAAAARAHGTDGRPVPAAQLHLTLAFVGTVPAAAVPPLCAAAEALAAPPLVLTLDRIGYFAGARVQWLGASRVPSALFDLADALTTTCRALGHDLPVRELQPHVTLQRHVTQPMSGAIRAIRWPVREFVLLESGTDGRPGAYQVLARWPLAGCAGTGIPRNSEVDPIVKTEFAPV